MPEDDQPTMQIGRNVLPMDPDGMRAVPRVYSNYTQCSLDNDQVSLIFGQRQVVQVMGIEEPVTSILPQSMVYMTIGQFFKMVKMLNEQAERAIESLEVLDGEKLKEQLFGPKK